jgi:short-subunit dehydrogenase
VEPYGVGVSLVNPGPVATDFGNARGHPYDRERPKPVAAEDVAAAVMDAIEHNKREVYVPKWFRPAVIIRHLLPPLFRRGTARSFRDELASDAKTR